MVLQLPPSSSRRRYLKGVCGVLGVVGLAGCSGAADESIGEPPAASTDRPTSGTASAETNPLPKATKTATPMRPEPDDTPTPIHAEYETTEVRVTTPDGVVLGTVTAAIADTSKLRYLGLSDTESLPRDRGMLFVFDDVGDRTFVMRGMDFGIDIVYADDEGVITRIHHAPAPGPNEDGNNQRYPGRGRYVLEVNYEWTTEHDVEEGDVLDFDL